MRCRVFIGKGDTVRRRKSGRERSAKGYRTNWAHRVEQENREVASMRKQKLIYRFHDPNPPGVLAEHVLNVLIEANFSKIEEAVLAAAKELEERDKLEADKPPKEKRKGRDMER